MFYIYFYFGGARSKDSLLGNFPKLHPDVPKLLRSYFEISSSSLIILSGEKNNYKEVLLEEEINHYLWLAQGLNRLTFAPSNQMRL